MLGRCDGFPEHLVQAGDRRVAFNYGIAQPRLPPRHLFLQRGILALQLAQPANIGAIGSADEMGEYVHLAEDLASPNPPSIAGV
jgi:hypothetical protein